MKQLHLRILRLFIFAILLPFAVIGMNSSTNAKLVLIIRQIEEISIEVRSAKNSLDHIKNHIISINQRHYAPRYDYLYRVINGHFECNHPDYLLAQQTLKSLRYELITLTIKKIKLLKIVRENESNNCQLDDQRHVNNEFSDVMSKPKIMYILRHD